MRRTVIVPRDLIDEWSQGRGLTFAVPEMGRHMVTCWILSSGQITADDLRRSQEIWGASARQPGVLTTLSVVLELLERGIIRSVGFGSDGNITVELPT